MNPDKILPALTVNHVNFPNNCVILIQIEVTTFVL
jgi:hypothetical protein